MFYNFKKGKMYKNLIRMLTYMLTFVLLIPSGVPVRAIEGELVEKIINDFEIGDGLNKFTYSNGWSISQNMPNLFYNGDEHWVVAAKGIANPANTYFNVKFEGEKIEIYGDKGPMLGKYSISIDGGEAIIVDAYNQSKIHQQKLFESNTLINGIHNVKVSGTGLGTGTSADIQVDYVKVYNRLSLATGVQLSKSEVNLEVGDIQNILATVVPDTATNKEIIWASDNNEIVTVNNGLLEGKAIGSTKVTATVKDTNIKAECLVNVVQASVEKVYTTNINDSEIGADINKFRYYGGWNTSTGVSAFYNGDEHWSSISKGASSAKDTYYEVSFTGSKIELYATTAPAHGIYSVSIDGGAAVEINAYSSTRINQQKIFESPKLAYGDHIIKVSATGKGTGSEASMQIDYAKIYHKEIKAQGIEIESKSVTLEKGIESRLEVIYNPSNTSVKDLEWSSSNNEIVSIQEDGTLLAKNIGEAIIKATLKNTNLTAECKVTVLEGNDYIGGFVGSTERHNLEENYASYIGIHNNSDSLIAWKGDKAISKIVLYAKSLGAKNITVKKSDLVNEKGNKIDSSNITATFLKNVKAAVGYGNIPGQEKEEIADILYTTNSVSVERNKLQQIWVDFNIPRDAESGLYKGQLEVLADGLETPLVFNYEIEILGLTQPTYEESKFHLDLWQYPYSSARYYGVKAFSEEHFKILKPQMELYKNAGGRTITTTIVEDAWNGQTYDKYTSMVKWTKKSDGTFNFDYSDFDKWVAFNLSLGINKQISAFSIVPWENRIIYFDEALGRNVDVRPYPGTAEWTNIWNQFLTKFVSHLDEKGWFDMVYIAMDERPVSQMISALNLIESKTNKDGHTLKVSGAMNYSTMDRNILNRIDDISIHASHTNHNSDDVRNLSKERKALGLNTTLYTCTGSYPSNFTRSEPSENIWTIWYSAYHNTNGCLRWAYDSWVENPLEDTSHRLFEAGDTFLIYPGDKGTENIKPRSSVRFEKMSEAIRDVEKITYLKEHSPELASEIETFLRSINRFGGSGELEENKKAVENEAIRIKKEVSRISKKYISINNVAVESVNLDKESLSIEEGNTAQLIADIVPSNTTNKNVKWTSSNESVATVSNGIVTAVTQGTAVITVTTEDGEKIDTCNITVSSKNIGEIIVGKPSNILYPSITSSSVVLNWTAPKEQEGLTGYVIYKDGKILREVDTTTVTIDGLRSNTIYGFKVVSKYSNNMISKPISVNIRTIIK